MGSGQEPEAQWPPRSPHEALISTPGGRSRYRQLLSQTSPSPSPVKRSKTRSVQESDDEADEDEETLQLKLQELQAKLKLKKLQNTKAKGKGPDISGAKRQTEALCSMTSSATSKISGQLDVRDEDVRLTSQPYLEVPASPVRRPQVAQQQQASPRRVKLGIDKGLKAADVSLKRAPSFLRRKDGQDLPQSRSSSARDSSSDQTRGSELTRPITFSERLASARSQETLQMEKQQRIAKARTKAFGIGREEMESYKRESTEIPEEPDRPPSFTRDEVLSSSVSGGSGPRHNTVSSLQTKPGDVEGSSASFEAYSGLHLSRRFLPHTVLARHISGKKILNIKDLLRQVKAPDFQLPDVEQDIIAMGIIAKKSEPRDHKPGVAKGGQQPEDRGKYMLMTLSDLDYDIDLFLFNSGFQRFWKLTEGTVVAILNPNTMPPPPGRRDTGRFSLIINSDEDIIMEIGTARDLGYCQSIKRYGDPCGAWINKKRTKFCEYHSNEAVKKMKASRVEMNTNGFGGKRLRSAEISSRKAAESGKKGNYDWESKTSYFVSRSMSTADLIDGKDKTMDRKEKEENLRRRLTAQEKEREFMQKLGRVGNGAGKEYMQRSSSRQAPSHGSGSSQHGEDAMESHKATLKSLDLQRRERTIQLGPLKRKRAESSEEGLLKGARAEPSTSLGWGGGLRDKLARMKDGEKLRPTPTTGQAPVQKKTRFVTSKGIREAGRESLGMDLSERQVTLDDDDDDELIIVK